MKQTTYGSGSPIVNGNNNRVKTKVNVDNSSYNEFKEHWLNKYSISSFMLGVITSIIGSLIVNYFVS